MKRLLVPIVAFLAFSMLTTCALANNGGYYAARFQGSANGACLVFTDPPGPGVDPEDLGRGRVSIRGSAIVGRMPDFYIVDPFFDPDTYICTLRTSVQVSWGSKKLMVYMWHSDTTWGMFWDFENWFSIANMTFSGYYLEDATLQRISGTAQVLFAEVGDPGSETLASIVVLWIGTAHFRSFGWVGEGPLEYLARGFNHRVTVWPISSGII